MGADMLVGSSEGEIFQLRKFSGKGPWAISVADMGIMDDNELINISASVD